MRRTSNFTKKTRSGKILTIAREHYLRDDLYCGSAACKTSDTTSNACAASHHEVPRRARWWTPIDADTAAATKRATAAARNSDGEWTAMPKF